MLTTLIIVLLPAQNEMFPLCTVYVNSYYQNIILTVSEISKTCSESLKNGLYWFSSAQAFWLSASVSALRFVVVVNRGFVWHLSLWWCKVSEWQTRPVASTQTTTTWHWPALLADLLFCLQAPMLSGAVEGQAGANGNKQTKQNKKNCCLKSKVMCAEDSQHVTVLFPYDSFISGKWAFVLFDEWLLLLNYWSWPNVHKHFLFKRSKNLFTICFPLTVQY